MLTTTGCSSVWQSTAFGTQESEVQILSPRFFISEFFQMGNLENGCKPLSALGNLRNLLYQKISLAGTAQISAGGKLHVLSKGPASTHPFTMALYNTPSVNPHHIWPNAMSLYGSLRISKNRRMLIIL